MKTRLIRRCAAQGFTLIELLLAAGDPHPAGGGGGAQFAGRVPEAKKAAAAADFSSLAVALGAFEVDTGRYPTSAEGLGALCVAPGGIANWKGPYIEKAARNDPWGNPYVYACPGTHNTDGYDLHSFGPSGQDGADDNINSWASQ